MRQIIEYFSKNYHLTNFLLVAVLLGGVLSWFSLRKEEMPEFDTNWLSISAAYPGASAEDVEKLVIYEIEKRLRGVSGIDEINSTASPGRARLSVTLEPDLEDKNVVIQSIKDAALDANLPDRVRETVSFFQWKTSEKAILDVALYYENHEFLDFDTRKTLQSDLKALENQLVASPHISRVSRNGYLTERLEVRLDPDRLQKLELPVSLVASQIRSQNLRQPAGSLEDQLETKVSLISELDSIEKLESLVIRNNFEGNQILLKDIAEIDRLFEVPDSITKINGREAIILNVYKSQAADILVAAEDAFRILERFGEARKDTGLRILPMDDESTTVRSRIDIISSNGILGFVLILVSLFIFLEWKSGIWVATGIPFSLAFTAILGLITGMTVNNVTLAAVIIVLGIVVDDAIIVAESISRLKSRGVATKTAVVDGTRVVLLPILASILTTCVAFFPFYFFGGRFGNFVVYIPSIVTIMLLGSLLESVFILPSHLQDFRIRKQDSPVKGHWFFKVESLFAKSLRMGLRLRWLVVLLFIGIAALAGYIFKNEMRFVLFPSDESTEVFLRVEAEENLDRRTMAKKVAEIESILLEDQQLVVAIRTRVGQSRRGGQVRENQASMRIELVGKEERELTSSQVIERWEKKLEGLKGYAQLRFIKSRFGFSSGSPIEILIQEANDTTRNHLSERLKEELEKVVGVSNVEIEKPLVNLEYEVSLKKDVISRLGISAQNVATSLQASVGGLVLYTIPEDDEETEVRLVNVPVKRETIDQVLEAYVANNTNRMVPLKGLVNVEKKHKPISIERTDYKRTAKVFADLNEAVPTSPLKIAEAVEDEIFPNLIKEFPSAQLSFRGEVEESRSSQRDFQVAALLAVTLIYGILFLLFKSFVLPFIILLIVPFGFAGIILAFYAQGLTSFGFFAVVGAIGMAGVVVNDSIVLTATLRDQLNLKEKFDISQIAEVTSSRLRAVMVTTITTVSGLFPTAYGFAGYDAMLAEMMLAMGWGLLFGTLITLGLTPVLFTIYASIINFLARFRSSTT